MGYIIGIYDLKILVCDIGNFFFLNYVLGCSWRWKYKWVEYCWIVKIIINKVLCKIIF